MSLPGCGAGDGAVERWDAVLSSASLWGGMLGWEWDGFCCSSLPPPHSRQGFVYGLWSTNNKKEISRPLLAGAKGCTVGILWIKGKDINQIGPFALAQALARYKAMH